MWLRRRKHHTIASSEYYVGALGPSIWKPIEPYPQGPHSDHRVGTPHCRPGFWPGLWARIFGQDFGPGFLTRILDQDFAPGFCTRICVGGGWVARGVSQGGVTAESAPSPKNNLKKKRARILFFRKPHFSPGATQIKILGKLSWSNSWVFFWVFLAGPWGGGGGGRLGVLAVGGPVGVAVGVVLGGACGGWAGGWCGGREGGAYQGEPQ